MKWPYSKISTKVTKLIKIPHLNVINKSLYLDYIQPLLSGHRIAYKLQRNDEAVIFYKRGNLNVFGKLANMSKDRTTKDINHFLLPLSHKNNFAIYHKRYVSQYPFTVSFRFVGSDYELYEVIYKDRLRRSVTIRKFTNGDIILNLDPSGYIDVGIPLYNSYIPIAFVTDKYLKVLVYNLIDKQLLEVAEYTLDFLESEIFKYLDSIKEYKSGHKASVYISENRGAINKLLARYKMSYRIRRPNSSGKHSTDDGYEICKDFVVCKSFLYVTNKDLRGSRNGTLKRIFVLTFSVVEDVIKYELSIPQGIPIPALGLSKTPRKHIIDTKQVRVQLPNYNYKIPFTLYHDRSYAIVQSFLNENKYFIVASDGSIKYVINIKDQNNFYIHFADEFMFFVYKDEEGYEYDTETCYKILVYNTVKNYWVEYVEFTNDIYGFFYIKKCKNLVLFQGSPLSHMVFDLKQFTTIDLKEVDNDPTINKNDFVSSYGEYIDYYPSKHEIKDYIRSKYKNECPTIVVNDIRVDFTIDEQRGIIYMLCINETLSDVHCAIKLITLEYDLCNESRLRDLVIGSSIIITNNMLEHGIPLFISRKSLKHKGIPKYLSQYISKDFYDFMRNKSFSSDIVFGSYSSDHGIFVRDKYYNRVSVALKEFKSLRNVVHLFMDTDMVVLKEGNGNLLASVFIIDDTTLVESLNFIGG